MHGVNEHFKTVKNLLRKISPQPEFEPGISCLAGAGVFLLDHRGRILKILRLKFV